MPHWDPTFIVPVGAGFNFALLVTNYATGLRYIKLRSWKDLYLLGLAVTWMGIAYSCQDDMKMCSSPDALFQGHALWHSGMAIGIGFFYLFLRQERGVEGAGSWVARKSRGSSGGSAELMQVDALTTHKV